jgi:hypothetical protein
MCLARKFYHVLVEVLRKVHDLEPEDGLLRADRAIAQRFSVSESTARNWRRCTNAVVSPSVARSVITTCARVAPEFVPDLEFITHLSGGVPEVKRSADLIVDELSRQVFSGNSTWHIYSGPLKLAFDVSGDSQCTDQLLNRSSLVMERILEMGVDRVDIPSVAELSRYSAHGWWAKGSFHVREASLSSKSVGITHESINKIEMALYMGDGCAAPCYYFGDTARANQYTAQALELLSMVDPAEERQSPINVRDATIMINAMKVGFVCYEGYQQYQGFIEQFEQKFGDVDDLNDWVNSIRHEALGHVELVRKRDFAKAANHFLQARICQDRWLSQFGIPFSSTGQQSLGGYAMLMMEGPTDAVKAQILEGSLRANEGGTITEQIRAQLCLALLYRRRSEEPIGEFHRQKAVSLARRHNLNKWYQMTSQVLV